MIIISYTSFVPLQRVGIPSQIPVFVSTEYTDIVALKF